MNARSAIIVGGLIAVFALAVLTAPAASAAALSIKVEGNHFVDGEGETVRLLGVDHASFEYACVDGYGYDDGHMDDADAAAVASWNADAVRVPLNEDCWLGLNGQPNDSQGEPLTMSGYRQAVESYVSDLNAHGIYAILDLHWSAPGANVADGQQPMPDEHSTAFWSSVAETFKGDPAVVFDLFNEPYSPADPRSGDDPSHPVSWSCWRNGGCTVPYYEETSRRTGSTYTAVGMQALVDAVRATGATQPVLISGLDWANHLTGWVENAPDDPLGQEAASFHNYMGKSCDDVACWNGEIAPVAADVPVVAAEFAQEVCGSSDFDDEFMDWADAHGIGYLAWGWWVLSQGEIEAAGCSAYYLLTDWTGTAASPNGTALREHLLALPAGGGSGSGGSGTATAAAGGGSSTAGSSAAAAKIKLLGFRAEVGSGGRVSFRLRAEESCTATIAGATVKSFRTGGRKARKVALASTNFDLKAGKAATTTVKLPPSARHLLRAKGSLAARFTITLSGGGNASTVVARTVTLRQPQAKARGRLLGR